MSDIITIIKKHCVAISHDTGSGSGSGVLIQGMSDQYSYVLTAKHVLQIDKDAESKGFIDKQQIIIKDKDGKNLAIQELYHAPNLDISIIQIDFYPSLEIYPYKNDIERGTKLLLYGCPKGFPVETYDLSYIDSAQETREFSISGNVQDNDIDGFSGGGIFFIEDGKAYLYGIDYSIYTQAQFVHRVRAYHISSFEKLIESNGLARLMPLHLSNFSHITDDAFSTVYAATTYEDSLSEIITILHETISEKIHDSALSPLKILNDFQSQLITYRQTQIELEERALWVAFLEFMVIQLIVNSPDNFNDGWESKYLNKIFNSYRFIYTNLAKNYRSLYRTHIAMSHTDHLKSNAKIILVANGDMPPEPDSIKHTTVKDISIGLSKDGIANVRNNKDKKFPIIHWRKLNDTCLAGKEPEYIELNRIDNEDEMIDILKQGYSAYLKIEDD